MHVFNKSTRGQHELQNVGHENLTNAGHDVSLNVNVKKKEKEKSCSCQ